MGADKMSVFGLSHSIYNPIQAFNKDLNATLNTASPTVWHLLGKFTEKLKRHSIANYSQCRKHHIYRYKSIR